MKIGVVGAGFIGNEHLNAIANCGIKEPYVCDTNLENAEKLAKKYGGKAFSDYREMIATKELDCISVCVPTAFHYPVVMEALKNGVAVLCEKPFAPTLEEAEEMVKLSKETGTPLMVAHCLRFHKAYMYLKNAVKDERFGKLLALNNYRHSTMPLWSAGSWLEDPEKSGGAIVDMQIHEADIIVSLFGEPNAVTAVGDYFECTILYHYDHTAAISVNTSWRRTPSYPFTSGFDANFEKGVIRFDGTNVEVYEGENTILDAISNEKFPEYIKTDEIYTEEMRYFINSITTKDLSHCPVEESLSSIKTVLCSKESMKTRKTVNLK